jgi:pseudouridine-5'-phosphate glycosidase
VHWSCDTVDGNLYTSEGHTNAACRLASVVRALPSIGSGIVIAAPIPAEHAATGSVIQTAVEQAVDEATEKGIVGAECTPFLLARVQELTGGQSLEANIHLVLNNARVGAELAAACSQQRSRL